MKDNAFKKIWDFVVHEDSLASWVVNVIIAFVLVKYLIYPGLGFLLGTSFPIVAVVSGSMEHHPSDFGVWWESHKTWYEKNNFTKEEFNQFSFMDGFWKGDIMVLKGVEPKDIKRGQVMVYETSNYKNPIIHRVVKVEYIGGKYYFTTKGDNNLNVDPALVTEDQIKKTGKAIARVPLLGWIKIMFVEWIAGLR